MRVADHRTQVTPLHIEAKHYDPVHVLPADRIRLVFDLNFGDLSQRYFRVFAGIKRRRIHEYFPDRFNAIAGLSFQAHGQIEGATAFQYAGGRLAIQCGLDILGHLANIDAIAGRLVSINLDGDLRHADLLFEIHVNRAGNRTHNRLRLQTKAVQHR